MTTESKELAIQILYIDLEMRCALSSIHHHGHIMLMSYLDHLFHRIHRTEHIAYLGNTDNLGTFVEQTGEFIDVYFSFFVNRDNTDGNAFLGCLQLPRHNIGMVLHSRDDDLVALAHKLITERGDNEIQTLGSTTGKDDFLYFGSIDKLAYCLAGSLMKICSLLRKVMHTSMHIGIDVKIFVTHSIKHT